MKIKLHVSSNGVVLLTDHMSSVESISIKIWVKSGSMNESRYNSGISHFIEHMNFKGTETYSAQRIAEEFDMMGGYLNAYTGKEQTVYYAKILSTDFERALMILSDIVGNSTYNNAELERERGVILEEICEMRDDPSDFAYELFQKKQYEGQQAGKSIIGDVESVERITRDEILEYVDEFYNAKNLIVSVSGKLSDTGDDGWIRDVVFSNFHNFGKCRSCVHDVVDRCKDDKTTTPINSATGVVDCSTSRGMYDGISDECDAPNYIGGMTLCERDIQQTHMVIGFCGVSLYHPDYYTYQIAGLIAGGSMSSRLFQEIREKRGLVYSISAAAQACKNFGWLEVCASSQHDKINEVLNLVINELHKMSVAVYEYEVERAKNQIKSNLLMALESTGARAAKLAADYSVFQRVVPLDEIMAKIRSITASDVASAIKSMLNNIDCYNPAVAVVGKVSTFCTYDNIMKML